MKYRSPFSPSNRSIKTRLFTIIAVVVMLTNLVLPAFALTAPVARQNIKERYPMSTLTVNTLIDENDGSCSDGDCSLRDAIIVAAPDDTIDFSVTGIISLTMGTQLSITKNITITGPGIDSMTISGNYTSRVFYITGNADVAISDVTIANGKAPDGIDGLFGGYSGTNGQHGGGVYIVNAILELNNVVVNNSHAGKGGDGGGSDEDDSGGDGGNGGNGGGIYIDSYGDISLLNSIISTNMAGVGGGRGGGNDGEIAGDGGHGGSGGGIYIHPDGELFILSSTIDFNKAGNGEGEESSDHGEGGESGNGGDGGGIANRGILTVNDTAINNNQAGYGGDSNDDIAGNGGSGGGIYNNITGTLTMRNNTISNNQAGYGGDTGGIAGNGGNGGGIYNNIIGDLTIDGGIISNNQSGYGGDTTDGVAGHGGNGGGIYNNITGTLTINDSIINNNQSGRGGSTNKPQATVGNGGNGGNGGGYYNNVSETLTISNTSFSNNQAGAGGNGDYYGGNGGNGGGCYNDASEILIISNTSFSDNQAGVGGNGDYGGNGGNGGGVYNVSTGALAIDDVNVNNNQAGNGGISYATGNNSVGGSGGDGGGIYTYMVDVATINKVVADNNYSGHGGDSVNGVIGDGGHGGGIYTNSTLTLTNSLIDNNHAGDAVPNGIGGSGGGIYNNDSLMLQTSVVNDNDAGSGDIGGEGGGIYSDADTNVISSTISLNSAGDGSSGGGNGGGIHSSGVLILTHSTVSGNQTGLAGGIGNGGGVDSQGGFVLNNVTLADNKANAGGGVNVTGTAELKNTLIISNTGGNYPDIAGTLTSYGYNQIGNIGDGLFDSNTIGDQYYDPNNTTLPNPGATEPPIPIDPMLGALADNGGSTPTHALLEGSTAIDAGSCTDIDGNPVVYDQRGHVRVDGSPYDRCDIGAFEWTLTIPYILDVKAVPLLDGGHNYRIGFHQETTHTLGYEDSLSLIQQGESLTKLAEADYWYQRVLTLDPNHPDALNGLLDTHWEQSTAHMMMGNDYLVKALAVQMPPAGELTLLNQAIAEFNHAVITDSVPILTDPRYRIQIKTVEPDRAAPLPHGETDYADYRQFALAAANRSRAYLALGRYQFNQMNVVEANDAFRTGIITGRQDALLLVNLWPSVITDTVSYGQLQNNLAEMEKLTDYILADLTPSGRGPDFVPFWYDPDYMPANNYEQLHDHLTSESGNPIATAAMLEADALANERANDDHYANTILRLHDLDVQYDTELIQLCGANATGEPDIINCGTNGAGEMYIQLSRVRAAQDRVEGVGYEMEKIVAQIDIEERRAGQVIGIYRANAELITGTGEKLSSLAREEARHRQRQHEINTTKNILGNLASVVTFGILPGSGDDGGLGIAGFNPGALVNAALTLGYHGEEQGIIGDLGDIEARRAEINAYQGAQLQLANGRIEDINSWAHIQNLFLAMPALDIELSIAHEAWLQELGRLNNLIQQKEQLQKQQEESAAFIASVTNFQNPGYRQLRDYYTILAKDALEYDKDLVYQLGRALEYEINQEVIFSQACGHPLQTLDDVYSIRDITTLEAAICQIDETYHAFLNRPDVPVAQTQATTLYLSEALSFDDYYDYDLARTVTREEQFNDFVRDPANRDGNGNLKITFATSMAQGNPFFSAGVFNDKILSVEGRLWGNGIGDEIAVIYLKQAGTSFIRAVDAYPNGDLTQDSINEYNIESLISRVSLATNLNSLPPAIATNYEFGSRSIAFTNWMLVLDTNLEPDNFDVIVDNIEEIELTIVHEAYTLQSILPSLRAPNGGESLLEPAPSRDYQAVDWEAVYGDFWHLFMADNPK